MKPAKTFYINICYRSLNKCITKRITHHCEKEVLEIIKESYTNNTTGEVPSVKFNGE